MLLVVVVAALAGVVAATWAEPIVVMGMHRSGTSALAGALVSACDATLGTMSKRAAHLLSGNEWNAKGYFERLDVARVNDEMLRRHTGCRVMTDCHWRHLERVPESREFGTTAVAGRAWLAEGREMVRIVVSMHNETRRWFVLKDPRLSLTFARWRNVIADDVRVLIAVRDPRAVAASLWVRDYIRPWFAVALWERYMLGALRASAGMPHRALVHYEHACAAPRAVLAATLHALDMDACGNLSRVHEWYSLTLPDATARVRARELALMESFTVGHAAQQLYAALGDGRALRWAAHDVPHLSVESSEALARSDYVDHVRQRKRAHEVKWERLNV